MRDNADTAGDELQRRVASVLEESRRATAELAEQVRRSRELCLQSRKLRRECRQDWVRYAARRRASPPGPPASPS